MKLVKLFTLAGIAVFSASPVIAQTVGIGTTAKGATSQVSAAIAKVTSQFQRQFPSIVPFVEIFHLLA